MKNKLLSIVFVLSVFGNARTQTLLHGEILGRPTDNRISLQAVFAEAAEVCVRYGTMSGNLTEQTTWQGFSPGEPAELVLENLEPNTRYYYQLCHRLPGGGSSMVRPERTFHTQRPPGSTFTFVLQADPHLDERSDTALYRRCLKNQLEDSPDFLIDLGDIFMSDKMKNAQNQITHDTVTSRVRYMRSYYESVCHSMPLFIAMGNHEGEAGWAFNGTAQNVAVYGTLDRKKYFLNPGPDGFYTGDETEHPHIGKRENYYAWHWGAALFVVLDPYFYTKPKPDSLNGWRWTLGKTQYDWLKSTLESSTANFKFVFAHQLVGGDPLGRGGIEFADKYEWGGKNLDGTEGWAVNRPGWYKPIKDLLTENRVTTFFHGHDHFFAKQDKDCLIYQLCPQPSLPNFTGPSQADDYGYFAGQILPNAGHLRLTVAPEGVKTEYVRAYLPAQETPTRQNRDVSATYFLSRGNCYDSVSVSAPVLWNALYADELIYPNPSSGAVNMEFTLMDTERLQLTIVDASGRIVRHLLRGEVIPAGKFQMQWDGRSDSGQALPAGIYSIQISGGNASRNGGKIIIEN
jgi:predicted phosphodiesterase